MNAMKQNSLLASLCCYAQAAPLGRITRDLLYLRRRNTEACRRTRRASLMRHHSAIRNGGTHFRMTSLRDLIKTALKAELRCTHRCSRILEARAQLGITRADQLPSVAANASAVNERIPQSARIPSIETTATS